MNGTPHVHEPQIKGPDPFSYGNPRWYLVYGDTRILISSRENPYHWSPEKLWKETEKALKEAIRRHDEGTIRAQRATENREGIASLLKAKFALMQKDRWASEQKLTP